MEDMNAKESKPTIENYLRTAHICVQKAQDLAYTEQPQNYWVRRSLNRAQQILIKLIVHNKIK